MTAPRTLASVGATGRDNPPLRLLGALSLIVVAAVIVVFVLQYQGAFDSKTRLTVFASRSGLVMDPGARVALNGVQIGRVERVEPATVDGKPGARLTLDVDPGGVAVMPANVTVDIIASTLFGSKTVSFSSPAHPSAERVDPAKPLSAGTVSTEINTVFETLMSVATRVDPVKLNATLTAAAQAVDGLGNRFGKSIESANVILDQVNPLMPQVRADIKGAARAADIYSDALPDVIAALQSFTTTAATLTSQQHDLDNALIAAVGFGNSGGDVVERFAPFLTRSAADLVPPSALLDEYSPELYCMLRTFHDAEPRASASLGGNGYSTRAHSELVGAGNPYVYPDNLPRVNAHGGPEGKPGCWQAVTKDLWPAPYLVMDTGASIAPYNHMELGQPLAIDYVWGRQIGEHTINP